MDESEGPVRAARLRTAEAELAAVERALERLEDGSYGRCERCGEALDDAHLEQHPTSTTCARCGPTGEAPAPVDAPLSPSSSPPSGGAAPGMAMQETSPSAASGGASPGGASPGTALPSPSPPP